MNPTTNQPDHNPTNSRRANYYHRLHRTLHRHTTRFAFTLPGMAVADAEHCSGHVYWLFGNEWGVMGGRGGGNPPVVLGGPP